MQTHKAQLPQTRLTTSARRQQRLDAAWRTVGDTMISRSTGETPPEEAYAAAWAAGQVRHLLDHLKQQVGTIETALPKVKQPELRDALGLLLDDASERCGVLARDLDLARGEPLGEPQRAWSTRLEEPANTKTQQHLNITP